MSTQQQQVPGHTTFTAKQQAHLCFMRYLYQAYRLTEWPAEYGAEYGYTANAVRSA